MLQVEETGTEAQRSMALKPPGVRQRFVVFASVMSGLSLGRVLARGEHAGTVFELWGAI